MNKKGLIAVVVILVAVIGGYSIFGKGQTSVSNNVPVDTTTTPIPAGVTKDTFAPVTKDTADAALISRLKSASVSAAETGSRVALVNGKAQFSTDGAKGTIVLGDAAVAKTLGDTNYVLATIAVATGGSAAYQYAVLFEDKSGSLSDKSYASLGAGVQVTGIRADEISGGLVVTVNYIEAGKAKTKILVVENGAFNSAKEINL